MKTTEHLDQVLRDIDSEKELNQYLTTPGNMNPAESFAEYFNSLEKVQAIAPADLYKSAGIERTYGAHILSGSKAPGRDKIIRLCLAAGLSADETKRALESAGEAPLYSRSKRDAILSYAIKKHLSTMDTDDLLYNAELEPLK